MATIALSIMHPFKQEHFDVEWVSVQAPNGSFVVGHGHQPLISLITPGTTVQYKAGGAESSFEVDSTGGVIHITSEAVRLVLG